MSMKIVTWNVQGLRSRLDQQNRWKLRRDLEEYLSRSVADIIMLQEHHLNSTQLKEVGDLENSNTPYHMLSQSKALLSRGGLGLIDPLSQSKALLAKFVVRGLQPGNDCWKMLLRLDPKRDGF